jgi:hypothetical protein
MKITSPVDGFPGTVERPDYLTLPQVLQFEEGLRGLSGDDAKTKTQFDAATVAFILPFFSLWDIAGVPTNPTPETFPGSPRKASAELIAWLLGELVNLYTGETDIPNA